MIMLIKWNVLTQTEREDHEHVPLVTQATHAHNIYGFKT